MPQMQAPQFYQEVDKGLWVPLYFLFGEESYLIHQAVDRLKLLILNEDTIDFNFNSYYAGDVEVERVRDAVEMLPVFSSHRLIIVKDVQEWSDKDWDLLSPILQRPVNSSVFVLTATNIDKRKKHLRNLIEKAHAVEFKRPYENQIPGWIKYIVEKESLQISEEALSLLHKCVGSHLSEIESEVKKLALYLGDRKRIEVSDVASVVSRSKEENIFDLSAAIGQNDRFAALEHLVKLLDQGQNEVGIVSLVARQMRILLQVKKGMDEGLFGARLAQAAQVPPYFLDNYIRQSKTWTKPKLEKTLAVLSETDKALKSSPLSSHLWLENMVVEICN